MSKKGNKNTDIDIKELSRNQKIIIKQLKDIRSLVKSSMTKGSLNKKSNDLIANTKMIPEW